jgi:class 3 adenylate cyclase
MAWFSVSPSLLILMAQRLSQRDRVALTAFVAVWAFLFVTKAVGSVHPLAQPVAVERARNGAWPVVHSALRPAADRPTQLQQGDALVSIGGTDMRGQGQLGVLMAFSRAGWQAAREVPVVLQRSGVRLTVSEPMPLTANIPKLLSDLIISLILGACAILILLRAKPSPSSTAMVQAQMVDSLLYVAQFDASPVLYALSMIVGAVTVTLAWPLLVRAALAFPEEAHGRDGLWRLLPLPLLLVGIPLFSATYGFPLAPALAASLSPVGLLAVLVVFLFALTHNFRRSSATGRRQVKWLLYATYLGALLSLPGEALVSPASLDPPLWYAVMNVLVKATFPVSVLIAALRFDLLDINRLFGVTVLYNVLAAVALGAGFLIVPRAADLLTSGLDIGRQVAQTMLTIVLAGIALLAARMLRGRVERRFFGERYALEAAMHELPERFASVRKAEELWEITGTELTTILRPSSCVIYASSGDALVPVFADDESHPALLSTESTLVQWARTISRAARIGKRDRDVMGLVGVALLDELDIRVIVPIHRKGSLEAMICLGEKRSGDIYTNTDEALLTALGKTLSSHMLRFDEAELLERARAMQQRMQRYVPGALADVIAAGAEIETGEREVSVLFVDIRGYTAFSDGRDAREIFSTVNRYTEAVSSIVREEGGVVVEFNGDGMMAVFGAPRPLPDKEASAVRASARLAREVPAMAAPEAPLFVGVGVATGPAFVGNIEAVDRMIWSAIGNTTNLAARLQTYTRTAAVSVLIDERTWERAASAREGFVPLDPVQLKGRKAPEAIYGLSLPNTPAPPPATPIPFPRFSRTGEAEAPR